MGSKGRVPPYQRRPLPGPGMLHPDAMVPSGIHHLPHGAFPFDVLPPPEIMEQKLVVQHEEMQRLVTENRRLANTHFTLRQELAAAQQELQRLESHMGAVNADQGQQMRVLLDKMTKMETDLQASEPVKVEYQQACAEAQSLAAAREELISKVQQLTQDLQKSHGDVQEIPTLMSELEALRQEYQHYRAVYDYEKKLFTDHYESLQVMERNYVTMVKEVEKLRAELANANNLERSGGTYGSNAGYKENDTSGHHSVGQNAYEDGYGVSQVRGPPPVSAASYSGGPPVTAPARAGYDAPRGPGYESYNAPRNATYNPSWGGGYDDTRGGSYEAPRGGGYGVHRGGSSGFDAAPRGAGGAQAAAMVPGGISGPPYGSGQAQTPPPPYGSGHTPTRTGAGYEAPHGGNVARR